MIDRILESFERLTKAFQAKAAYSVPWEYSVSEATSTTFTGRATSTDCPHPDLVGIPLMSGIAGTLIKPAVGSLVGVMFLNSDPTKPRCVSWDQTAAIFVAVVATDATGTASNEVDFTPTGMVVSPVSAGPQPQAVALAPAVQSFANAAKSMANIFGFAFVSAGAAFTALASDPALTTSTVACTTAATLMGNAASACGSFISAVNALGGTFPTGFAATKTTTR